MKKKIIGILMCLCMVLALMPQMVFAEGSDPETCTVTLNFEHGTLPDGFASEMTVPTGNFTLPELQNCDDYEFDGWMCNGHDYSKTEIVTVNGNMTFTARYNKFRVTYEYKYGTLIGSSSNPYYVYITNAFTLPTLENSPYPFIGWKIPGSDYIYPGGAILEGGLGLSSDTTVQAIYEDPITLTVPFTTTVKQSGNVEPGKKTFNLEFVDWNGNYLDVGEEGTFEGVEVSASVETNGVGSYKGTMTITGPSKEMRNLLVEGALVRQTNDGEANWTYDNTVWGLFMKEETSGGNDDVVAMAVSEDPDADAASKYYPLIQPTIYENGSYDIDWDADSVETMTFTNTYTGTAADSTDTEGTSEDSEGDADKNAKTGDDTNLALLFALLGLSAAGLIGTGVYGRRKADSKIK